MGRGTPAWGAALVVAGLLSGCAGAGASHASQTAGSPAAVPAVAAAGPTSAPSVLGDAAPPLSTTPAGPARTPPAGSGWRPVPARVVLPVIPVRGGAAGPSTARRAPAAVAGVLPSRPAQPNRAASGNWSGYVATGAFREVSGTWTEPVTTCTSPTSTAAFWVGLGGAPSYPLYQAGSGVLCRNGVALHVLWYELVTGPGPQSQVDVLQISAGDRVGAAVDLGGGTSGGVIRLVDSTMGRSLTVGFSPEISSSGTAEWIAEATTATATGAVARLADFGALTFHDCSTDHGRESPGGWPARQLTALTLEDVDGGTASPGPLSSEPAGAGGSFTVAYGS